MDGGDDELESNHEAVTEDDELEHELADDEPELYCYCIKTELQKWKVYQW